MQRKYRNTEVHRAKKNLLLVFALLLLLLPFFAVPKCAIRINGDVKKNLVVYFYFHLAANALSLKKQARRCLRNEIKENEIQNELLIFIKSVSAWARVKCALSILDDCCCDSIAQMNIHFWLLSGTTIFGCAIRFDSIRNCQSHFFFLLFSVVQYNYECAFCSHTSNVAFFALSNCVRKTNEEEIN